MSMSNINFVESYLKFSQGIQPTGIQLLLLMLAYLIVLKTIIFKND